MTVDFTRMAAEQQQVVATTCAICVETFNRTIRKKVTCGNCNTDICSKCIKRYLAENLQQPNCMQCRWIYTNEFMDTNFSVRFRKSTLRHIREVVVVEREKQHLPELMHRVKALKEMKVIQQKKREAQTVYYKYNDEVRILRNQLEKLVTQTPLPIEEISETKKMYESYNKDLNVADNIYHGLLLEEKEKNKVYLYGVNTKISSIVQCIVPDCKGYLDNDFNCGLCGIKVCKDCHVHLEDGHECKPENVESVKAIASETKPCPTCHTPIFKIIGCDQMFCTQCHTAFSWMTGAIVRGRLHNPHYYEWVRQRNQGTLPREMGDVPCGGLPLFKDVEKIFAKLQVPIGDIIYIREILKMAVHLQNKEIPKFPITQGRNTKMDMNSINYMAGVINERVWKNQLIAFEIEKEMNTEQRLLLDMMLAVLIDYFNNFKNIEKIDDVSNTLYVLEELRKYYNTCIINMNKRFDVRKFRQIPYDWSKLILNKERI